MGVLLVACACGDPASPVDDTGVVSFVDQTSDGGDSAQLEGELQLAGSCLVVVTSDPATGDQRRVLPVFQRSRVSWDGTSLTQDGTTFAVGEAIDLGGGYASAPTEADYIPSECEYDEAFYVAPR